MKRCACGKPLGPRNQSGQCPRCYQRDYQARKSGGHRGALAQVAGGHPALPPPIPQELVVVRERPPALANDEVLELVVGLRAISLRTAKRGRLELEIDTAGEVRVIDVTI